MHNKQGTSIKHLYCTQGMMSNGPNPTGEERGSGKCNRIHSKQVAVICILATVTLTLVFLVMIIALAVQRTSLTQPQESLTCIPCDTIKLNANKNIGLEPGRSALKQREDGMCCGPVESITQMLFQTEMATQYYYGSSGQSHHKVLWNKNGPTFYTKQCVHLELEGEIFVRQPGYYIVSSQLNLRQRNDIRQPKKETKLTIFSHHVDLLSHKYGTTGVLMQTEKTIDGNGVYFTSFLSAVFKLNKYDRLSVSVSHPELLNIGNYNDHFLAYYTYEQQY